METFAFILLSIVILLLMVLIHEAGHYTTAKILGFTVDEFAIGFGPKIFSRRRKNGELFSLRALPLGGFCAFYGETDPDDGKTVKSDKSANSDANEQPAEPGGKDVNADVSDVSVAPSDRQAEKEDLFTYVMNRNTEAAKAPDSAAVSTDATVGAANGTAKTAEEPAPPRLGKNGKPALTFNAQKPWKRIIVLFGGVLFNFLSAIIFSLIYIGAVGYPVPEIGEVYTYVNPETQIETKYNDFEKGDRIIAVDGREISVMQSYEEIMRDIGEKKSYKFTVLRGGKKTTFTAERKRITPTKDGAKPYDGFGFEKYTEYIGNNAANAFTYCVPYTGKLSWSILGSFGDIITGKESITNLTGPVGSINVMAQVSAADWRNILILLPLLASNLAIFNLLPIPALDGAHVVFTVIEWIRKKPINRKVEGMIHFVGMIVLLLFVFVVDILSFAL